jgi:hypothetical protein
LVGYYAKKTPGRVSVARSKCAVAGESVANWQLPSALSATAKAMDYGRWFALTCYIGDGD